jgi:hypothetical protein
MGGTGLEQIAKSSGKPGVGQKSVAESVARDRDLAKIAAAWAKLPKRIRKAILALVG